jgi:NCS1 family nucleobase:cation symporter-1
VFVAAGPALDRDKLAGMRAADLGPVPPDERHQSALDLFLIFAGANIVATTLQTGATLASAYEQGLALVLIVVAATLGSAVVAALAPLGPRLGVPSIIAARAALGTRGAALVAVLLYVTNFAWIAINNVIAASVLARAFGPAGGERGWALVLGLLATAVVARGPSAVRAADRIAVPVMIVVGAALTWAVWQQPATLTPTETGPGIWRGFDVVIGYQVSWLLMFADYSRYTRSPGSAAAAVFFGLLLTSLWFMPLGLLAARAAASMDPGLMLDAAGLGTWGAILLALATITTNFVNIYVSTLAWKSLAGQGGDQAAVWSIGLIGTALGLFSTGWLERYADFMLLLGSVLIPVGGVLLAHYVLLGRRPRVAELYDLHGRLSLHFGFRLAGMAAWLAGTVTYFGAARYGSTLPSIVTAVLVYVVADALTGRSTGVPRATTSPAASRRS